MQENGTAALSTGEWDQLCEVMNAYTYSQTLATASDFDLFTKLSRNPGATQEDLQTLLSLSPHATRVLMLACCTTKLVRRDDQTGRYWNSPMSEKVLVSGAPFSMLPFVKFNQVIQHRCSLHLTEALKADRNVGLDEFPGAGATLYQRLTEYPDLEVLFQQAMAAYTQMFSPRMLALEEFSEVSHLLDVGGGNGSNAIKLCERFPEMQITILETPTIAQIARAAVARAGLEDRIRVAEGDMFTSPWPPGCDAVLLCHIVEIFSTGNIGLLYQKSCDYLPAGGKLLMWTVMASDDETGRLQAAKSSIYFCCTASGEGMAYPATQHESLLRAAGFATVERYDAIDVGHGALVATK